ncbi:MAG: PilZ domain-containing protein [Nitrospinota bacterium]|nr:PilZ domain-containing protein [Nitrospinota bacterium]
MWKIEGKTQGVRPKETVTVADENRLLLAEVADVTFGGTALRSEGNLNIDDKFFVVFPRAGDVKENEVEAEVVACSEINVSSSFKFQARAKFLNANQKYVEDAIALIKVKTSVP